MKWSWTRPRRHGAIALLPGRCNWLVAEANGHDPAIVGGGSIALEASIFPPPPEGISPLSTEKGVAWTLVAPLAVRGVLAALPVVAEAELAQGFRWEAEKLLHVGDLEPVYDYEILAPVTDDTSFSTSLPSVLVAVRQSTVNHWQEWTQKLAQPLRRLEPAFSAAIRAFCRMAVQPPFKERCFASAFADASSAVVAVFDHGRLLLVRNLAIRIARRGEALPLQGEDGIRNLRETLLACEDSHPLLEIEGLCGFGALDADWLAQAARASHLELMETPMPPAGVPAALHSSAAWFLPFGGLLGHAE